MAVNKVVFGENTLIDITDTTAVASDVKAGKDFYLASGQKITGTAVETDVLVVDSVLQNGGIYRNITTINHAANLQASKSISTLASPQTIEPDEGYDGFADGTALTITAPFTSLGTMSVYVGDYTNDTITLTTGRRDKFYRRLYGR